MPALVMMVLDTVYWDWVPMWGTINIYSHWSVSTLVSDISDTTLPAPAGRAPATQHIPDFNGGAVKLLRIRNHTVIKGLFKNIMFGFVAVSRI